METTHVVKPSAVAELVELHSSSVCQQNVLQTVGVGISAGAVDNGDGGQVLSVCA